MLVYQLVCPRMLVYQFVQILVLSNFANLYLWGGGGGGMDLYIHTLRNGPVYAHRL